MKEAKTILVTGIGGNVGQGIAQNIAAMGYPITIIGTDIAAFSAGTHLCHYTYQVPYAQDPDYISAVQAICQRHQVDLILMSTDMETYYLACHADRLPPVVVSCPAVAEIFLDKYNTWVEFQKHGIPFAEALRPSEFTGQFADFVAKPRRGRGSRGVVFNPQNPAAFSDEDYLIQKRYFGRETTTAFYVNRRGHLVGHITFERELQNGYTALCWVVDTWDAGIHQLVCQMMAAFPLCGSYNIQAMVTPEGEIMPFEINGRISGTNSIRARLGFNDVKMAIDEWCYGLEPEAPVVSKGVGLRILKDVIYPGAENPADVLRQGTPPVFN